MAIALAHIRRRRRRERMPVPTGVAWRAIVTWPTRAGTYDVSLIWKVLSAIRFLAQCAERWNPFPTFLPAGGYGYLFGGSGAECTKRENLRAMEAIGIGPHFLAGVMKPDLSTTVLATSCHSRSSCHRWEALSLGQGNAPVNEPDPVKGAAIMNRRKIDLNFDDHG